MFFIEKVLKNFARSFKTGVEVIFNIVILRIHKNSDSKVFLKQKVFYKNVNPGKSSIIFTITISKCI